MPKSKSALKPPGKISKKQAAQPQTVEDFQDQADEEENRGGKWRAGDIFKSARAFQRALSIYDSGLTRYPHNFDLAYNKARLQLEISQQPSLLPHFGLPLADFLTDTLLSHRHALALNDDDSNLLFNTAQVLTSLAEERLKQSVDDSEQVQQLHEALELFSSCLAKQEILLEQQSADSPDGDNEAGGVSLEEQDDTDQMSTAEETVTVIEPITPSDLLDTVHASMSALTTLVGSESEPAFPNLENMAQALIATKALAYLQLLPEEEKDSARQAIELDRAVFACALAHAQFSDRMINFQKYLETFATFDIQGKSDNVEIVSAECEARIDLVSSVLTDTEVRPDLPAIDCWKQLGIVQDLLTAATKLTDEEARDMRPKLYERKGDTELLRLRVACLRHATITETIRKSIPTLLKNARTFYAGAVKLDPGSQAERPNAADKIKAVEYLTTAREGQRPALSPDLETVFTALTSEGLLGSEVEYVMTAAEGAG